MKINKSCNQIFFCKSNPSIFFRSRLSKIFRKKLSKILTKSILNEAQKNVEYELFLSFLWKKKRLTKKNGEAKAFYF